MATTFYDELGTLTTQQVAQIFQRQQADAAAQQQMIYAGNLTETVYSGLTQATYSFWRNQPQQPGQIITTSHITTPIYVSDAPDWPVWIDQTHAITDTQTWATWTTGTGTNIYLTPQTPYVPLPPNPEYEAQLAREAAELGAAKHRALMLLESLLTEVQRNMLKRLKHFDVIGSSGKRYRIRMGSHGNVYQLDDQGREIAHYCGQPNGVPVGDMMLAQKLQIETDEAEFLRLANRLDRAA